MINPTHSEQEYLFLLDQIESERESYKTDYDASHLDEIARLSQRVEELEGEIFLEEQDAIHNNLCPYCGSKNIIHDACGENRELCKCLDGDSTYYCFNCSEIFNDLEEISLTMMPPRQLELSPIFQSKPAPVAPKCVHLHQPVKLVDGSVIHCTAYNQADKITHKPNFGLYADQAWVRICLWRNELINWPDMSLPKDFDLALHQIEDAWIRSERYGEDVDIGCLGAHGRTGTILAIMQMLASDGAMSAEECCQWVWENYCTRAIETQEQEWFVSYAAHYFFDVPLVEPPKKYQSSSSSSSESSICVPINHYAMMKAGLQKCANGPRCKWWEDDIEEFNQNGTMAKVSPRFFESDPRFNDLFNAYKSGV